MAWGGPVGRGCLLDQYFSRPPRASAKNWMVYQSVEADRRALSALAKICEKMLTFATV
jgi:hypothetical protein